MTRGNKRRLEKWYIFRAIPAEIFFIFLKKKKYKNSDNLAPGMSVQDKEIGLKIATNDEEKYWGMRLKESTKYLNALRDDLKMNEAICEMVKTKLKMAEDENNESEDSS